MLRLFDQRGYLDHCLVVHTHAGEIAQAHLDPTMVNVGIVVNFSINHRAIAICSGDRSFPALVQIPAPQQSSNCAEMVNHLSRKKLVRSSLIN